MKDNKGFSLVELIIVIAIMAVLVGIVGMQVIPYIENTKKARDIQILSAYATAGVMAYSTHPDCASTDDMTITVVSSGGGDVFTCSIEDAQKIADELKHLIAKDYITNADDSFQSKRYRSIDKIVISYDFANKRVQVTAYEGSTELNGDDDIYSIL